MSQGRKYVSTTHKSERLTKVRYRRPYGTEWEDLDLDEAMRMIADRVWESRERTFEETKDGQSLMQTKCIAHLGGATLDNEENYLIKKLFTGGLGKGRAAADALRAARICPEECALSGASDKSAGENEGTGG